MNDFDLKDHPEQEKWPRSEFEVLSEAARTGGSVKLIGKQVQSIADLILLCFLTEGPGNSRWVRHVLLEGVNGTGKTVLARSVAKAIAGPILWTLLEENSDILDPLPQIVGRPDLSPQDIVGGDSLANSGGQQKLRFSEGPLLSPSLVFFADELNRTPPRSLNVLLQAMASSEVTITTVDDEHPARTKYLNDDFGLFLIAAQNPEYHEGTFPLPEALMDRFMVKIPMHYTNQLQQILNENPVLRRPPNRTVNLEAEFQKELKKQRERLRSLRDQIAKVKAEHCHRLAAALTYATWPGNKAIEVMGNDDNVPRINAISRLTASVRAGVTPRGAQALIALAQARAWANNRSAVTNGDLLDVLVPVFRHRILLDPTAAYEHLRREDAGASGSTDSITELLEPGADGAPIARTIRTIANPLRDVSTVKPRV